MSDLSARPTLEPRRLPEKTDDALLGELRRVAAVVPGQALAVGILMKHGRVSRSLYNKRVGGWPEALAAEGLSAQSSHNVATKGAHPSRNMANEDTLQVVRDLAVRVGVAELTIEHVREHLSFSGYTLRT